jgi:DNA-binding transcriptional LysR family regulator
MSDYALTVLGAELFRELEQQAPNVRLRVRPTTIESVDDAASVLRTVDLMVLPRGLVVDLPSAELHRDRWVCVCSADNRLVGDTLSREDFGRLRWIVTYDSPTQFTPADKHLKLAGIERHADVVVENFLALPFLLAGTQRACILQERLARKLQVCGDVRMLGLPVEIPELVEAAWWHPSRASDPGHRWLQRLVRGAAVALGDLDTRDGRVSNVKSDIPSTPDAGS